MPDEGFSKQKVSIRVEFAKLKGFMHGEKSSIFKMHKFASSKQKRDFDQWKYLSLVQENG